jgi:uncharacterized membrane protein
MATETPKIAICQICKQAKSPADLIPGELVRESIAALIKLKNPKWNSTGFICREDLDRYRSDYIRQVLATELGEITALDEEVVKSLAEQALQSRDINALFDRQLTLGERLADKIAEFGGSWRFIIIFAAILFAWVGLNSLILLIKPFDPFPFIFLNLILSCLAAIQAPIIMMSQNRQEAKDRLHADYDYRVNLKAELEIRHLQEKMDHLLKQQWQHLLEIQQIQMELLQDISRTKRGEND